MQQADQVPLRPSLISNFLTNPLLTFSDVITVAFLSEQHFLVTLRKPLLVSADADSTCYCTL